MKPMTNISSIESMSKELVGTIKSLMGPWMSNGTEQDARQGLINGIFDVLNHGVLHVRYTSDAYRRKETGVGVEIEHYGHLKDIPLTQVFNGDKEEYVFSNGMSQDLLVVKMNDEAFEQKLISVLATSLKKLNDAMSENLLVTHGYGTVCLALQIEINHPNSNKNPILIGHTLFNLYE